MRQEINNQGVHTGEIILEEIQVGDSIVFPTIGEKKAEKRAFPIGWEYLATLNQEAAGATLTKDHPRSVFNRAGQSADGEFPSKTTEWEIGYGIVHETPLFMPYEELVDVLCRVSKERYVLLRSRKTRHSNRFI